MHASEVQHADAAKLVQKRLSREEKRILELNQLIKKIYEDNVKGKLSDKRFEMLLEEYEKEQTNLEESVTNLKNELKSYEDDSNRVDKFIELVHKYTDFTELTTPMINEFVDKIVVHEADKSSGVRMQQIDIYLKYVGKLDAPMKELTPDEFKEEEKKRAWNRNYMRRKYEKDKAEREALELQKTLPTFFSISEN